ncbi:MAG: hypothetical protein CMF23_03845 [Ignavibacteriae bacterium]|nr:hypothetical protein [Ignavibacteriota bacterium]
MTIPKDISGNDLIISLKKIGYEITRQKGSHIRLSRNLDNTTHHITIPNHNPIKIGTLNNILKDIAETHKKSKKEIISLLFNK